MIKNSLGSLIYLRLSRFYHKSNALSNDFLNPFGLTVAQFDVLLQVHEHEPISQVELAKKVTVSQGGISKMLTRLEKEGFIYKSAEWKTKYISLTSKGKQLFEEVFDKQLTFQTSLFDECLTQKEQKELMKLLTKLHKHAESKK